MSKLGQARKRSIVKAYQAAPLLSVGRIAKQQRVARATAERVIAEWQRRRFERKYKTAEAKYQILEIVAVDRAENPSRKVVIKTYIGLCGSTLDRYYRDADDRWQMADTGVNHQSITVAKSVGFRWLAAAAKT